MLGYIKPNPTAAASYCNLSEEASFQIVLAGVRSDITEGRLATHKCMDELTARLYQHARETRLNDLKRCLDDPDWGRMMVDLLSR